jgi:hypothetical protein
MVSVSHRAARDAVLQRHAIEKLYDDERLVAVLADLVNGTDVGVVQGRRRTRFAPKTFEGLRNPGHRIWQELQSYEAAEFGVLGLVNHAHAAPAELLADAVVRTSTTCPQPAAEPALFLLLGPLGRESSASRQRHLRPMRTSVSWPLEGSNRLCCRKLGRLFDHFPLRRRW